MLQTIALSKPDMQGIPITSAITDPMEARQTLTSLSAAYPGEIFAIETQAGAFDPPMFVTWIPSFAIQQFFTTSLISSYSQVPEWPDKP